MVVMLHETPHNEPTRIRKLACYMRNHIERCTSRRNKIRTVPILRSTAGITNNTVEIQATSAHRITGLICVQVMFRETHAKWFSMNVSIGRSHAYLSSSKDVDEVDAEADDCSPL
jgi:hypothetical protein